MNVSKNIYLLLLIVVFACNHRDELDNEPTFSKVSILDVPELLRAVDDFRDENDFQD